MNARSRGEVERPVDAGAGDVIGSDGEWRQRRETTRSRVAVGGDGDGGGGGGGGFVVVMIRRRRCIAVQTVVFLVVM